MNLKKLSVVLVLIFILLAMGFFAWNIYNRKNCYDAKCRVPKFLSNLKQIEIYEKTKDRFRALYSGQIGKVRLDLKSNVSNLQVQELFENRKASLESLFEERPATYPGTISRQTTCQQKYKPVIEKINQNNVEVTIAKNIMFTDRFTIGACVDDLLPNKGFIAWYWCQNTNTFYQVEALSPKDNDQTEELISKLGCSN